MTFWQLLQGILNWILSLQHFETIKGIFIVSVKWVNQIDEMYVLFSLSFFHISPSIPDKAYIKHSEKDLLWKGSLVCQLYGNTWGLPTKLQVKYCKLNEVSRLEFSMGNVHFQVGQPQIGSTRFLQWEGWKMFYVSSSVSSVLYALHSVLQCTRTQ